MSQPHAILAEYATPGAAMKAAVKVREAGYENWDVHTPFPVHGMDEAMGLDNAKVGWFTFFGGLTGFTLGMTMIWFMNSQTTTSWSAIRCSADSLLFRWRMS